MAEDEALPRDLRSKFLRFSDMIEVNGLEKMREPYVKHLDGKLWEMRLIGRDGIARRKDPEFMLEYDALEDEFVLAATLIGARANADLSQVELAERMGTSQSAIARLESGRVMPSTRTLRKLAAATGTKLRIVLQPEKAA